MVDRLLVIWLKVKSNEEEVKGKKWQIGLSATFKNINDDGGQKHQDRNLIDAMHHPKVEIGRFVGIRFLKNPDKIMTYFSNFKKFL